MKLHVIYRLCDRVPSLHGLPRPWYLDKKSLIRICAPTLAKSLQNMNHTTTIVGDTVSQDTWDFALRTFKPENTFNFDSPAGDGKSLLKASEFAMTTDDEDWIYFVEDDYLHDFSYFGSRVVDFINMIAHLNLALPCFMHPTDYPDQYKNPKRSYVFQGNTGYWREVSSMTHTFMVQAKNYKKFVNFFRECHLEDGNDGKMSTIFRKEALCFCPLPGVASHMHLGTISNYINWQGVIEQSLTINDLL